MKKAERLRKAADFKKAYKEGKRFLSPHFVLYKRGNNLPCARLGISISKSHIKLATRRNKVRRTAKELFRKEVSPRSGGYDFAVASRTAYSGLSIKEAVQELRDLILKSR